MSDMVEINYPCLAQNLGQENLEETVGNILEFKNQQEAHFQNYMERELSETESGLSKPAEGIGSYEIVIPIVIFIANNHLDTLRISGNKIPPNGVKNTFITNPQLIPNFVDSINSYLNNNPVTIGGITKRFRICLATKDTTGEHIDSVNFVNSYPIDTVNPNRNGFIPYGRGDSVFKNYPKYLPPKKYLRVTIGAEFLGRSWGHLASQIIYSKYDLYDGINLDLAMFGPIPVSPPIPYFPRNTVNATGASFLHEFGHYLDLQHTFQPAEDWCGDNGNNNCRAHQAEQNGVYYTLCSANNRAVAQWDFVKDTPPQSIKWNPQGICSNQSTALRTCSTLVLNSGEMEKMLANAVSGSPNLCVDKYFGGKAFTRGQLERMYYAVQYYRPELVSPENLVRTGVKCKAPLAQFTYNRDYVCGSGSNAQIQLTSLDNQMAGLVYKWEVTGGTATFSPTDSLAGVKTIQFTTSTSGIATLTLQVKSGGAVIKSTSIPVYVHSDCGSVQPHKKNMFFGTYAGLNFNNDTVLFPRPDTSMYNPDTFIVRSTGGTVTYNDPVTGKMKFYATGKRIWNSQLQLQIGVTLSTNEGTSQYGIAVPSPSDSSRVWFFTVPNSDSALNSSAGLRWHKVRPKYLADSSQWNLPVPYGTNPSAGGSAKVNEKITAIPKSGCSKDGYWLISQGAKGTANAGKFLVFRVTDTVAKPVTYSAKFASKTGFIKPSPMGNKILVTYSDRDSSFGGYGTGKNARVFNFNRQTGAIDTNAIELRIPGLPSGTTEAATYGCAFSPDGTKAFINVNAKDYKSGSGTGATYHVLAGIYQFDLTSASNPITGVRISRIPQNINPSLDMMTGPDGMIYLSSTVSVGLRKFLKEFNLTQNFIPESGGALGVIHFPDAANPGLSWDGPHLTKRPGQNIRSTGGLSNFLEMPVEVVVPEHGLTQSDPKDLGTNPMTCCGYPVYTQNVACTGNDNGTAGNDFYYKFTVDQICGPDYPGVVIKTCGTEFPVNTLVMLRNFADTKWDTLTTTHYSVSNCSGGNGQIFEIGDLTNDLVHFGLTAFRRSFQFLVEVEAQSPSAIGNFKTEIQIQEDYEYETELGPVACGDPLVSCCRMAVDGENPKPEKPKETLTNKLSMKLVPNPAKDKVSILLEGLQPGAILSLSDGLGRELLQLKVEPQTELDIRGLAKGIYRVRARDNLKTVIQNLIVE